MTDNTDESPVQDVYILYQYSVNSRRNAFRKAKGFNSKTKSNMDFYRTEISKAVLFVLMSVKLAVS